MDDQSRIVAGLGRLLHSATAGFAMGFHIRHITPSVMMQSYPAEWDQIYARKGLLMRDPTVLWGFDNTGVARWADLAPLDHDNVMGQAAEHGIRFGFTYATDADGSRSITSFARPDRDFADAEIDAIREEVDVLHRMTADLGPLSPRTLEAVAALGITLTRI